MDGKTYSNTLFFEKELGFKGMLIEPISHLFNKLIKLRENNICENYAIDTDEAEKLFIGNNATSGLYHLMSEKHLTTWHQSSEKYKIKTIRLDTLLHKHNIKYIDFFSIDVEGGEYVLLQTMDWNIPMYIICIELDNNNIDKDNECRKILAHNNFKKLIKLNNNEFYINENYTRKSLFFDKNIIKDTVSVENNSNKNHIHYKKAWKELPRDFENKIIEFENNRSN